MSFSKSSIIVLLLIALGFNGFAQEAEKRKFSDIIEARGYVKYLNTTNFLDINTVFGQNLVHHRLNLRGYFNDNWTAGLEMRNRVFSGVGVTLQPGFGDTLNHDPGLVDMSWTLINGNAFVAHSTIDRAWVNYTKGKFEARLGRQRINWGINTVWNPNDLFNAFNYLDFDYEERPGSDAIRVQYYTGDLSGLEVAYAPGKDFELDKSVIGGVYRFNKKSYDIQVLGGMYRKDLAAGIGWAGNIKDGGFKGEATYFHPREDFSDTTGIVSATVSGDYSFKNGIYVMASLLYNSNGLTDPVSLSGGGTNAFGNISAKSLMPSKYSTFASVSGQLNPLLMASGSVIYAPGMNLLFIMPNFSYSLSDSWELMLLGQTFLGEVPNSGFDHLGSSVFVRVKWSY